MSERIDVSPLSPARQCARSYSFGMRRPLAQGDLRLHPFTIDQGRHDADLLVDILARTASTGGTGGIERFDFLADHGRQLCSGSACSDAQANFIRSVPVAVCASVQRRAADEVDAHFGEL